MPSFARIVAQLETELPVPILRDESVKCVANGERERGMILLGQGLTP